MTRVLLIEDSIDVLEVLQLELESLGYEVYGFFDAREALKACRRLHPDVIVSDIRMPGLDGYDFIKRIRKIADLLSVPAIALTGTSQKQEIQKVLACGFTAHLTKPVEARDLGQQIERLTASRLLKRQAS